MTREYGVDFNALGNSLTKKPIYKLADVKDRLETVAFDIVRFKSSDEGANLWKIESSPDDGDYIVTLYEEEVPTKTANVWEASLSKTANILQVFYKGDPLVSVSTTKLGIPTSELGSVSRYLPAKLAENTRLQRALLSELSPAAQKAVFSKYPELIQGT